MNNLHHGSNGDHNQDFFVNKFSPGSYKVTRRRVIDSLTPPVIPSCTITPVKRRSKKSPPQVRARPCRGNLWISPALGESWHQPPISTMKEFSSQSYLGTNQHHNLPPTTLCLPCLTCCLSWPLPLPSPPTRPPLPSLTSAASVHPSHLWTLLARYFPECILILTVINTVQLSETLTAFLPP